MRFHSNSILDYIVETLHVVVKFRGKTVSAEVAELEQRIFLMGSLFPRMVFQAVERM